MWAYHQELGLTLRDAWEKFGIAAKGSWWKWRGKGLDPFTFLVS
jgi:hypothetical protein